MSNLETIRPRLRDIVRAGRATDIDVPLWVATYEKIPGTDITADSLTLTIAELIQEQKDIELLRSRVESEGD